MAMGDHKTSEALNIRPGDLGDAGIVDTGRIVAVKGNAFWKDFMEGVIVPVRRETALMIMAQLIQRDGLPEKTDKFLEQVWDLADRFTIQDKLSLEKNVGKYFEQYMARGDADEMLQAAIDNAHDWSA